MSARLTAPARSLERRLVWLFAMLHRKVFRRFKGARTPLAEEEEKIADERRRPPPSPSSLLPALRWQKLGTEKVA